ncbi:hypothetical protein J6590_003565 [Homalodisca vitripennis]|nr:hypothetical protein J6590_003565 [Homalodisca vitripennis]
MSLTAIIILIWAYDPFTINGSAGTAPRKTSPSTTDPVNPECCTPATDPGGRTIGGCIPDSRAEIHVPDSLLVTSPQLNWVTLLWGNIQIDGKIYKNNFRVDSAFFSELHVKKCRIIAGYKTERRKTERNEQVTYKAAINEGFWEPARYVIRPLITGVAVVKAKKSIYFFFVSNLRLSEYLAFVRGPIKRRSTAAPNRWRCRTRCRLSCYVKMSRMTDPLPPKLLCQVTHSMLVSRMSRMTDPLPPKLLCQVPIPCWCLGHMVHVLYIQDESEAGLTAA